MQSENDNNQLNFTDPQSPTSTPPELSTSQPSQPPVKPSSNKTLFIVLGAVAGGLVVLGLIGWAIYATLFSVSKADYAAAARAMNDVRSKSSVAYSDVTKLSYLSTSGTETKVKNDIDTARTSLKELKAENNKLQDLRALRDSEVKEAYDAYRSQFAKFDKYSAGILDSIEILFPALKKCSDVGSGGTSTSNIAAYQAGLASCIAELEKSQKLPDADLQKLSEATLTAMKSIKVSTDELATLPASNYQRASEIRKEVYAAQNTYRDATTDARSNTLKNAKEAEIKDAYNDLAGLLNDKQFN